MARILLVDDDQQVREMLKLTLNDCQDYLAPGNICLVVDGDERSARIAARICKELAACWPAPPFLLTSSENRGKEYAVRKGVRHLLEKASEVRYLSIRDCDGDHSISDLPHLLRLARHIARAEANDRVIIIFTPAVNRLTEPGSDGFVGGFFYGLDA